MCQCSQPSPGTASSSQRNTTIRASLPFHPRERDEVSPYSIVGLSATWDVTKNVSLTGGVDNVFDKRQWRAGNAQTTGNDATGAYMYGAGAYTYNEPGRTWYMGVNTRVLITTALSLNGEGFLLETMRTTYTPLSFSATNFILSGSISIASTSLPFALVAASRAAASRRAKTSG